MTSMLRRAVCAVGLTTGLATASAGCSNCGSKGGAQTDAGTLLVMPDANPDDPNELHFQGTIQIELRLVPLEGITTKDDAPVSLVNLALTAKGDSYRWDLLEGTAARGDYRVYDRSAHRFYTVLPSETLILATPESGWLVADAASEAPPHYGLVDEHKTGSVLGHGCQMYNVHIAPFHYEVCASSEFIPLPFHMMPDFNNVVPFGQDLEDQNLFPLSIVKGVDTDAGAQLNGAAPMGAIMRVQSIEKKPIDPSVFRLPKYTIRRTEFLLRTGKMPH